MSTICQEFSANFFLQIATDGRVQIIYFQKWHHECLPANWLGIINACSLLTCENLGIKIKIWFDFPLAALLPSWFVLNSDLQVSESEKLSRHSSSISNMNHNSSMFLYLFSGVCQQHRFMWHGWRCSICPSFGRQHKLLRCNLCDDSPVKNHGPSTSSLKFKLQMWQ